MIAKNIDKEMLNGLGVNTIMQAHYASLDIALDHDIETGRSGGVVVQDFSGASFSDIMSMVKGNNAWDFQKISHATQNTLPFRVGGFLIVNAPWWMRMVLAVVKPMLKPKMKKKIRICNSTEDLLEHFTPDQLATMYGGKFEICTKWVDEVFAKRGELSDGKYVDSAPRTEALEAQLKGDAGAGSEDDYQEEKKNAKQKKEKQSASSSSEEYFSDGSV